MSGEIVGVDLATHWAYATGKRGQAPKFTYGTFSGNVDSRLHQAFRLGASIARLWPRLVAIERVPPATRKWSGRGATKREVVELLNGYVGAFRAGLMEGGGAGAPRVLLIEVEEARKAFIGCNPKRDRAKVLTVQKCIGLGWMLSDGNDDVADAISIWSKACSELDTEEGTINGKRIIEQFARKA